MDPELAENDPVWGGGQAGRILSKSGKVGEIIKYIQLYIQLLY